MSKKATKRQPGDTFKKGGVLYRVSSSGKPFKSSNSKKAQQQRSLNQRLDQPIAAFQGPQGAIASPITERDLAHQAQTATDIQFGPQRQGLADQLTQAVNQQAGVNTWYNQYRQQLGQYQQQVQAYNAGAMAAAAQLPGAVQGLQQQQAGQVAQQQGQMPTGTAQVGDAAQLNSNAAAIGQAMAGNWSAFLQNQANQSNQQAATQANVVAPQQQAVAAQGAAQNVAKVKAAQTSEKAQEGAYNQNYRTQQRQSEGKNLLAEATLGVNTANNQAKLRLANKIANTNAADKNTKNAQNAQRIRDARKKEIHRHSEAMKNALTSTERVAETKRHNRQMEEISRGKTKTATKTKPATGPGSLPAATEDKKVSQINQIYSFVKSGPKWSGGPNKGKPMTPEEVIHHYQAGGTDINVLRIVNSLIANNGKLGPGGVALAHKLGIHVNGRWGTVGSSNIPSGKV